MNKWTDLDELVKNIIAIGVIFVTLSLEVAVAFNPDMHMPQELTGASALVLAAYGFQTVQRSRLPKPPASPPADSAAPPAGKTSGSV